jgi:hypothetical protein
LEANQGELRESTEGEMTTNVNVSFSTLTTVISTKVEHKVLGGDDQRWRIDDGRQMTDDKVLCGVF